MHSLNYFLHVGIIANMSQVELKYPARCFYHLSKLSQTSMGGASGALYGILLASASNALFPMTVIDWAAIWKTSVETLQKYSKANLGDRTMVIFFRFPKLGSYSVTLPPCKS